MGGAGDMVVEQSFRYARKVGDNYVTGEMKVILPVGASDAEIQAAIATGVRIGIAMGHAVLEQVDQAVAEQVDAGSQPIKIKEPDAPASEKQIKYLYKLSDELGLSGLAAVAATHNIDLAQMTKSGASTLIEYLTALKGGAHGSK